MSRVALLVASVALVVGALVLGRAPDAETSPDAAPAGAKLYLAGIGELTVVDVERDSARRIRVPQIGAGDPPHLIAPVGDRLALWSYDVSAVPFDRPGARPSLLAENGWIFIPSADPDAIWVGFLEKGQNRRRRLSELREIDSDGSVLTRGVSPPGGSWPQLAAPAGLLFPRERGYLLWDPDSERTVGRFSYRGIGDAGPISGDLLASCGATCEDVVLTDVGTGSRRVIEGLPGKRLVAFEAEFSPDGSKLAVPVLEGTRGWQKYSEEGRRLAIVDVVTGEIDVVRRSRVPSGYVFTGWSSDGTQAFITGGQSPGKPRTILSYRLGEPRAQRVDVRAEDFYAFVAR